MSYPTTDITSDDKLWALLSYIFTPVVPLIILLAMEDKKERPFLKYHYMQALVWGIVWAILYVIVIGLCLSPLYLVGTIYFAIKAYQGEMVVIPWLTEFAKSKGWIPA